LSQYEKAIGYYDQALSIYRQIKNRPREGLALNGLGLTYESLSQYDKAIAYHEQALVISREVQNRAGEASALNNSETSTRV